MQVFNAYLTGWVCQIFTRRIFVNLKWAGKGALYCLQNALLILTLHDRNDAEPFFKTKCANYLPFTNTSTTSKYLFVFNHSAIAIREINALLFQVNNYVIVMNGNAVRFSLSDHG